MRKIYQNLNHISNLGMDTYSFTAARCSLSSQDLAKETSLIVETISQGSVCYAKTISSYSLLLWKITNTSLPLVFL